ncbi:MAG: hypothetical protein JKY85_03295, partial [Porticoccus sp.]|nr:hypothetical protein [Porticoccus sp.]
MRRLLLIVALIFVVGGLLAWQMIESGAYILIVYGNYTIDMSLWALLLMVIVLWLIWRVISGLLRALIEPSQKYLKERSTIKQQRNRTRTAKGLLQYIEGHWDQARRTLRGVAKHSEMPLVSYLAAANSAYEIGDQEDADRLLAKAQEVNSGGTLAIGLVQARMYLRDERYEEALAILQRLYSKAPEHPLILRWLNNAYRGLKDWASLEKLLPDFRRYKVFSKRAMQRVESEVYSSLLESLAAQAKRSGTSTDADELIRLWHEMPKSVRSIKRVLLSYITSLHQVGEANRAESLLRKSLKTDWDEALVRLYGIVDGEDPQKQLITA